MTLPCQPCGASAARTWLSRRPTPASAVFGVAAVEVRHAEGRGLGIFAARAVGPYTAILIEPPLILMQPTDDFPELYRQFLELAAPQREAYLALSLRSDLTRDAAFLEKLRRRGLDATCSADELQLMVKVANIMQINAFNVDVNDGRGATHRALFPSVARINHSCAPNAHVCFYPPREPESRGRMFVHAIRPLVAGEEVLISYFNLLLPRVERQSRCQKWGFVCDCAVCDERLPDQPAEESLRTMRSSFLRDQARLLRSPVAVVEEMAALLTTAQETLVDSPPALRPSLPDVYDALGMLQAKALMVQKRETGWDAVVAFLEQATIWDAKITGPDSPATARRLEKLIQFARRTKVYVDAKIKMVSGQATVVWSRD